MPKHPDVWPGMPYAEFLAVAKVVHRLLRVLNLRHWEVTLISEPAGEGNAADITAVEGQWRAFLRLGEDWATYTPELKRRVLVHELLHVHLDALADTMRLGTEPLVGKGAHRALWATYRLQNEYAVDALATAIAGLIDWEGAFEPRKRA